MQIYNPVPYRAKTLDLLALASPCRPGSRARQTRRLCSTAPPLMMSPLRRLRGHIGGFKRKPKRLSVESPLTRCKFMRPASGPHEQFVSADDEFCQVDVPTSARVASAIAPRRCFSIASRKGRAPRRGWKPRCMMNEMIDLSAVTLNPLPRRKAEFAIDVEFRDVELHVVAEAVEDELLRDASEEFGAERLLRSSRERGAPSSRRRSAGDSGYPRRQGST